MPGSRGTIQGKGPVCCFGSLPRQGVCLAGCFFCGHSSEAACCANHQAGLFRSASWGQRSQSSRPHWWQNARWKASSQGLLATGIAAKKAARISGDEASCSKFVTASSLLSMYQVFCGVVHGSPVYAGLPDKPLAPWPGHTVGGSCGQAPPCGPVPALRRSCRVQNPALSQSLLRCPRLPIVSL